MARVAYNSWEEPAALVARQLDPGEPSLVSLGAMLGVAAPGALDRMLLVARIEDAVSAVTNTYPPRPRTGPQAELLKSLGHVDRHELTFREADATIRLLIARERLRALERLRPVRGDTLVRVNDRWPSRVGELVEVTSIDRMGRIWTRHANGYPALPQHLMRLAAT